MVTASLSKDAIVTHGSYERYILCVVVFDPVAAFGFSEVKFEFSFKNEIV